MAAQTVEAFARIGEMLIALKDETPHGQFGQKCAEVFGQNVFTEYSLKAAMQMAGKYMRLAQHRDAWLPHNPSSMNEALSLRKGIRHSRQAKNLAVRLRVALEALTQTFNPPPPPRFITPKQKPRLSR